MYKPLLVTFSLFLIAACSPPGNISGLVARYSLNKGNAQNEIPGTGETKAVGVTLTEDRFGNSNQA